MAKLKDQKDVTFHIVGGGSEYEHAMVMVKEAGAENIVKFYGPKPFKEAMTYYKIADACMLTLDGKNRIGDTLPGKLQTYMAAGKPVIGAINGAGNEVIKESRCGLSVRAGDSDGLANAFLEYIAHQQKYANCGEAARKYFRENFTQEKHFETLEARLKEMINQ